MELTPHEHIKILKEAFEERPNYNTTKFQGTRDVNINRMYDTTELGQWVIQRNYEYTIHPFKTTYLTSDGSQYLTAVAVTTGITSKSTALSTAVSSTINWPGLDGSYIDEIEFGLTAGMRAATATVSTIGFYWQWKDDDATTWQLLSTARLAITTGYADRTMSGYAKTGTGYSKLPVAVRLIFWGKTASKGSVKAKCSSYVKIKAKKTA